jgi:hypothetical protein
MGGMISIQDALFNELCDYLRVFGTKRNSFPPRRNGRAYRHSSVSPFENSNFEASKASGAWVERMNMTIAPTVLISRKSILNQIPTAAPFVGGVS